MPDQIDRLTSAIESLTAQFQHGASGVGSSVSTGLAAGAASASIGGLLDTSLINNAARTISSVLVDLSARITSVFSIAATAVKAFTDEMARSEKELHPRRNNRHYEAISAIGSTVAQAMHNTEDIISKMHQRYDIPASTNTKDNTKKWYDIPDSLMSKTKTTAKGFNILNSSMLKFGAGLAAVLRGLQGTREGYLLNYSTQHVFYEIADALRGPIRLIINEIEGFANVLHMLNIGSAINPQKELGGVLGTVGSLAQGKYGAAAQKIGVMAFSGNPIMEAIAHHGIGEPSGLTRHVKDMIAAGKLKSPEESAKARARAQDQAHLQPMLQVSFGNVADLQNKMQQLVTENPAQERGLSFVENIYNVLVKILNAIPWADKMSEIPDPTVKPLATKPG